MENAFKNEDLEILIATMNRNSLDFLNQLFPFVSYTGFRLLIVNQTDENCLLHSDYPNVRVINSFERGLSKSRNLALQNTLGKIVLIADDDVIYPENFQQKIIQAYNNHTEASIICFRTQTKEGKLYSKYPAEGKELNSRKLNKILSIEVTANREALQAKNCVYNEWFGLGAKFEDAETLYFLRRAFYSGLKLFFCPETIVVHESYSSSDEVASDRLIYAKMAGFYKRFGFGAYYYLLKYMFFLIRKNYTPLAQIKSKFLVGLRGIKDYKFLLNTKADKVYE